MNPVGKILAQIGMAAATTVGKAFKKAFKEQAAKSAASSSGRATAEQMTAESNKSWGSKIMPPDEAYKVLNVEPKDFMNKPPQPIHEAISESYKRLFKCNDVTQGGSFYLQSKIFRAKQTLDRIHPPAKASQAAAAAAAAQSSESNNQSAASQSG